MRLFYPTLLQDAIIVNDSVVCYWADKEKVYDSIKVALRVLEQNDVLADTFLTIAHGGTVLW